MNPLADDSDKSWDWYGKNDPYYGVFSVDQFRGKNLSEENLKAFFDSGVAHVHRVLGIVESHLGPIPLGSCLDFGCGVGRLAIPFAARFGTVAGIDISPSMIAEAQRNCARYDTRNINFFSSLESAPGLYDLVHTYVVLQHIPVKRGLQLIDALIDKTAPSGAAFLHLTIGRNKGRLRDLATFFRKNIRPLHWVLNLLQGRKATEAYMQSNRYPLNALMAHLHDRGIRQIWVEVENHEGPYSVCLAFRRSEAAR